MKNLKKKKKLEVFKKKKKKLRKKKLRKKIPSKNSFKKLQKELSDKLESRGIHQGPKKVNPTCLISHSRNDNSANGSAQSSQQYHM